MEKNTGFRGKQIWLTLVLQLPHTQPRVKSVKHLWACSLVSWVTPTPHTCSSNKIRRCILDMQQDAWHIVVPIPVPLPFLLLPRFGHRPLWSYFQDNLNGELPLKLIILIQSTTTVIQKQIIKLALIPVLYTDLCFHLSKGMLSRLSNNDEIRKQQNIYSTGEQQFILRYELASNYTANNRCHLCMSWKTKPTLSPASLTWPTYTLPV